MGLVWRVSTSPKHLYSTNPVSEGLSLSASSQVLADTVSQAAPDLVADVGFRIVTDERFRA